MNHSGYISPWFPVYVFAIIIVALLLFKNAAGKKRPPMPDAKRDMKNLVPFDLYKENAAALATAVFYVPLMPNDTVKSGMIYISKDADSLLNDERTPRYTILVSENNIVNLSCCLSYAKKQRSGFVILDRDMMIPKTSFNAIEVFLYETEVAATKNSYPLALVAFSDLAKLAAQKGFSLSKDIYIMQNADLVFKIKAENLSRLESAIQCCNDNERYLTPPLTVKEMRIDIDTKEYADWYSVTGYTHQCVVKLSGKCNIFQIYENNSLRREFELGTVEGEDFSGKYFHLALRIHTSNTYCGPVHLVQADGFISDTPEDKKMQLSDIGYRMEAFPLYSSAGEQYMREQIIDRDLENKGLRYPGVTTPLNVRLIGWCPSCQRSFTFLSYALYNAQEEVAYSDDGLDVCGIEEYEIDKENWARTADGKIFRYYNPFRCPHCGKPYIDYKKHRNMKRFGNAACALLGKKPYSSSEMEIYIEEKSPESERSEDIIDDISYIHSTHHSSNHLWQVYDILLESHGYGWDDMISWAAYMAEADLEGISTVTTAAISGAPESEHIDEYSAAGNDIKKMKSLEQKLGVLSIGGISRTLNMPVKIVWYNQTRALRFFTPEDDDDRMNRYIETMIRRTFGTDDAMKKARPVE